MNKRISIPEHQLILLLKERSESGFSILYDNYSPALYGVITRIVSDEAPARDVLQDTFVKIWKSIDSYSEVKGSIFTWMLNIARNTAIDHQRLKQNRVEIRNSDSDVSMSDNREFHLAHLDYIGVKEVVVNLKSDYRDVIDILYFKGFTQEEAAREMNVPLGTVKTRARTAIGMLRKLLAEKKSGH